MTFDIFTHLSLTPFLSVVAYRVVDTELSV